MKKIMIISDTHENQFLLRKAFDQEENITHIFHLGDNYEDLDSNLVLIETRQVFKVPGIYHPGYLDGSIPAIQQITISDWNIMLVHNALDPRANSQKFNIVFHGHTHQFEFRKTRDYYYINPGHLKAKSDRGRKPSYLTVDVHENKLEFKFKHLNGKQFLMHSIHR